VGAAQEGPAWNVDRRIGFPYGGVPDPICPVSMPIAVRTLFFAAYKDLLGRATMEVELPEGATVGDLVAGLRERGRPFSDLPERPAIAVNREYAPPDLELGAGDEVAFIPPVAGG